MGREQGWHRPARRRRPVRAGVLVAVLGLGTCLVGVAGLAVWNAQVVLQADGPVRETADGFFRDVAAGDTDRAYERLCRDARGRWSQAGFGSWVRTPPVVSGYEIVDVSVATRGGRPRGTVVVRINRDGGGSEERELPVVPEDGGWRVCGDPF
ncbi:Rv0361 family membrane protein [Micromonospora sediminicola]|uniref:Rv0361 family membrane protein n=1 Tax=Micromonospora sediminicola TaxID=946078 RepID=UPI0033CC32D3